MMIIKITMMGLVMLPIPPNTPEEAAAFVEKIAAEKPDLIKLMITGGVYMVMQLRHDEKHFDERFASMRYPVIPEVRLACSVTESL